MPSPGLLGLDARFVTPDIFFGFGDFFLLLLIGGQRRFQAFRLLPDIPGVARRILLQPAILQFQRPPGHRIQKIAIVRDDQHRARIIPQVPFQPFGPFQIEMVGRFVKNQQIRLSHQFPGQRDPGLLPAGKLRRRPSQFLLGKAQPQGYLANPTVHCISVGMFKPGHDLGILIEQFRSRSFAGRGDLLFQFPHPRFPGQHIPIGLL